MRGRPRSGCAFTSPARSRSRTSSLKRLDEVPADAWVITYCACPHHLSGIVLDELRKRGHKRAAVLDEGITEWHRRGYPVVAAEGVERPPPLPPQPKN